MPSFPAPRRPSMPLPEFLSEVPSGETIHEPAGDVPVLADADVAVLWGGPAGVMAATVAARAGARTVRAECFEDLGRARTPPSSGPRLRRTSPAPPQPFRRAPGPGTMTGGERPSSGDPS